MSIVFFILISRDVYQKLMNTNYLSRNLYQKSILLFNNSPIPAQYSDHMYTTVNPNTNQTIELTFDTDSCSANKYLLTFDTDLYWFA